MKRVFYPMLLASALLSSGNASDFKDNIEFCQKLRTVSPSIEAAAVDAYSITHHIKRTSCETAPIEEMKKILEKSDVYFLLLALKTVFSSHDRITNSCNQLFYETIVQKALDGEIDTVDGLKEIATMPDKESAVAFQSCSDLAKHFNQSNMADFVGKKDQ